MKITAIRQQVKRRGRYSVFVDEKYSFSLSELGLINSGLRLGQEISEQDLAQLKDTSRFDKAYNQALDLIARRQRSQWELEQYLARKGYEKELQQEIINKLSNAGYVNDTTFARAWISNRRMLKPTSRRKLIAELKQKRISEEIINEVLSEDTTDEREVLRELVERKRKQAKYQDNLKLMQYLARQGYSYTDIKEVISEEV
jgi:regulatory protein